MSVKNPLVLLIEDDLDLRELYDQRLRLEGFDVRLAFDGKAGLELARLLRPDLIILDLRLPKLDGFEFLRIFKNQGENNHFPIVVLSALWQEEDKQKALSLGADIYLVKSETTPKQVVESINKLLAKKEIKPNGQKEKIQLGVN